MRIAFCCDLHFTAKNEIRIIEGLNFLEYIFDYCVKNNIPNLVLGGDIFHTLSLEQQEQLREKASLRCTGEGNPMYGRHHSEESKKKMSKNSKGKTSGEKNGMYGKSGEKALNGKKVYMFQDEEHLILIKEFNSVNCVLEFLNLKGHEGLYKAIKNNTIYKNYYWSKNK